MLQISLGFWTLGAIQYTGIGRILAWLIFLETRADSENDVYGFRVRFLGISLSIEVYFLRPERKSSKNTTSATVMTTKGEKSTVNFTPEGQEWVEIILELGVNMVIAHREMFNDKDNSFVLPGTLGEVEISIGDRILFGDPTNHIMVDVTGSRVQEDESRIFYAKQVKIA